MNRFQISSIKIADYIHTDKLTGRMYGTAIYIGETTDLADRLYRHFKGLYESFEYFPNMEKGRKIFKYVESCNVKKDVLNNLGTYINVIVRDFTDSNIDIKEAEAEFIKEYKLKYGDIPMFNDREEKTNLINQTKIRQFFDTSSLSSNGV